jgi:hypothetical protein
MIGQLHALASLPPGKGPSIPMGPTADLDAVEETSLAPAGNQTPAVQHVARRYIDQAIPGLIHVGYSV